MFNHFEEASAALDITYMCMNTSVDWRADWTGRFDQFPYLHGTFCGPFLDTSSSDPILLSGHTADNKSGNATLGEALLVQVVPLTSTLRSLTMVKAQSLLRTFETPS